MNKLITLLIVILVTIPSFAQGGKNEDKNSQKEQIIAAKIAFFTSEIGLTPEEAQVFWPIYNKCWDDIQKAHKETRKSFKAIKELDEKGDFSESEMRKLINKYVACYAEEGKIQDIYLNEYYKILSTEKVAKLYIAEDSFRRKLTKMWKEQYQGNPKPDWLLIPPPPEKVDDK